MIWPLQGPFQQLQADFEIASSCIILLCGTWQTD